MRRLLQGDVGSGKTAVAAVALAGVVRAGWQGALMAPTEILARQHYLGLAPLLEALGVRAEFLSGSLRAARKRRHPRRDRGRGGRGRDRDPRRDRRGGDLRPAGAGRGRRAAPLRRGAARRRSRPRAGREPHLLALTATPIPRTLALTFYADMAISTLREMPPGRRRSGPRSATARPCRRSRRSSPPRRRRGGSRSWSSRWSPRARR